MLQVHESAHRCGVSSAVRYECTLGVCCCSCVGQNNIENVSVAYRTTTPAETARQ